MSMPLWNTRKNWLYSIACLGAACTAYGVIFLVIGAVTHPPEFASLRAISDSLIEPVTIVRRYKTPLLVRVPLRSLDAGINNVCVLWDCKLPDKVTTLRPGDRIEVWVAGHTVWQMVNDHETLLSYIQAVKAEREVSDRFRRSILYPVTAAGILLLLTYGGMRSYSSLGSKPLQ
jgi:hypothetical protein